MLDVIVNFIVFSFMPVGIAAVMFKLSRVESVSDLMFIKWPLHKAATLRKEFNFPPHLRWVDASSVSTGWGPLQRGPRRHKLLGEHSAPSCEGPLWQAGKGGMGEGVYGWGGDSLIKTAQLICILSKGTTVSSVKAQMVLCLEGEEV